MAHCIPGVPELCHVAPSGAPDWLVSVLVNPPGWVPPVFYGVGILTLVGAFWGYRRWGLSETTKVSIAFNGWLVVSTAGIARVLVGNGVAYTTAVAVAVLGGFLSAIALRRWCFWPLVQEHAK